MLKKMGGMIVELESCPWESVADRDINARHLS